MTGASYSAGRYAAEQVLLHGVQQKHQVLQVHGLYIIV